MASLKGMLNPKNYEEKGGSSKFKEGHVLIDSACYKVHKPDVYAGQEERPAYIALALNVTRLDEECKPLLDPETEEPITEELVFGMGGKSLACLHPAKGDSPSDESPEDLGDEVGTEGNMLTVVQGETYKLDKRSAVSVLFMSLTTGKDKAFPGAGIKTKYVDDLPWAPYWVGCIFYMKSWSDESNKTVGSDGKERGIPYKIVTRVVRGPEEGTKDAKGAKGTAKKTSSANGAEKPAAAAAAAASNGDAGTSAAESVLTPFLNKMSEDFDGKKLSLKEFNRQVSDRMTAAGIEPKTKLDVMSKTYKNDVWLVDNMPAFDGAFDPKLREVTFGQLTEA